MAAATMALAPQARTNQKTVWWPVILSAMRAGASASGPDEVVEEGVGAFAVGEEGVPPGVLEHEAGHGDAHGDERGAGGAGAAANPAVSIPAAAIRPTAVAVPVAAATAFSRRGCSTPENRTVRGSVARPREALSTNE